MARPRNYRLRKPVLRWSAAIGLGYFGEQAKEAIPALQAAQHDRAKVMIGMMVRQDHPPERLARHRPDGTHQLLPLRRARERIDHHHPVAGHDEAGVGAAFGAPATVAEHYVDAGDHLADGKLLRTERRDYERRYTETLHKYVTQRRAYGSARRLRGTLLCYAFA